MGFKRTLDAIFRVKELLAAESELKAIKQVLSAIKPQAGMESKYMNDFNKEEKLIKFNDIKKGTTSFVFNFKRVTDHSHINTDGVVFARVSDERFELSHATVVRLDMVDSIVVAQATVVSGAYVPYEFVGMNTLGLIEWREDSYGLENRQLANGKEDMSKKFAVVGG